MFSFARVRPHSTLSWPLLGALALTLVVSLLARYQVMESDALGQLCAVSYEWRCAVRTWLPQVFAAERPGWMALGAGVAGVLVVSRKLAALAVLAGAAGLVLYSYDLAAVGLLLGVVTLARPRGLRTTPIPARD